ncbi:MAG: urate hydroxylase PuuD [Lentisphaerae bacterium]|nr:urate hydroxylase PuuD [Lentisphaerota bacterium]
MEASVQEWLQIVARWIHVIAAIMWVGDSFLFMWMDSHLSKPRKPGDAALTGEIWLVHSGGFYEIYKRKFLRPDELPPMLYWFKWESYTTWISGIALLIIVYFMGGAAFLVDPYVRPLAPSVAIGLSLALLAAGWLVYDTLCRHLFKDNIRLAAFAGWPLVVLVALALGDVFAPRAAYLLTGAMLGTIMSANVFFRIIPAQRHMLAATRAGTEVDLRYGVRAKQRSTHNHYLTLPVLFMMLSNHFPSTYSHPLAWLVLGLLILVGLSLKILMNRRSDTPPVIVTLGIGAFIGVVMLTYPRDLEGLGDGVYERHEPVGIARVQEIVAMRCVTCHAAHPTYPAYPVAPGGVRLDTPIHLRHYAERILVRAVITKTMPLGNLTGISDAERLELGAWVVQGARIAGATNAVIAPAFGPAAAAGQ